MTTCGKCGAEISQSAINPNGGQARRPELWRDTATNSANCPETGRFDHTPADR